MKKRKILALVLALAMAVSVLAGCGGSSDSSGGSSSSGGSDAVSDENTTVTAIGEYTAENPYHCVFSYIQFYEQDENATKAVEAAMNEYLIPNYHIEIELLPMQYAEYQQKIQLAFTGGDELDIIPIYFTDASSWISMNGVYDMNEFMETDAGKAIIDAIGEENAYVGTMNGTLYGFPASKESVELGGLCMRADICDELGITEEYGLAANQDEYTGQYYSWDVATEIFEKVHQAYPNMTCLYMQGNSSQMNRFANFDGVGDDYGVLNWQADHDSTTIVNKYETEEYKNVVTRLAEWYDAGYIYKDALTDTQGSATMMKAGNTFSYLSAIKPGFLVEAEASNGCKCYAMYFGDQTEGYIGTTNVSFFNTGIATNSADPEMAFRFISALYSDAAVMNLWQYGIEGVNYQVLEDGTAYFVDGEDSANYAYHQGTGWLMGNQFISYVWNDGSKTPEYWDKLAEHNTWTYYSPAFGFLWDSSAYSTQETALTTALETYRGALETGCVGGAANVEATLQKLNDALYAAGLQDVMDAKQEQLDAYLESAGATQTPQENLDLINSAK